MRSRKDRMLTVEQVAEARRLLANGATVRETAATLQVSEPIIGQIVSGHTYTDSQAAVLTESFVRVRETHAQIVLAYHLYELLGSPSHLKITRRDATDILIVAGDDTDFPVAATQRHTARCRIPYRSLSALRWQPGRYPAYFVPLFTALRVPAPCYTPPPRYPHDADEMTIAEAAQHLGRSRVYVGKLIRDGVLPSRRVGWRLFVARADVEARATGE